MQPTPPPDSHGSPTHCSASTWFSAAAAALSVAFLTAGSIPGARAMEVTDWETIPTEELALEGVKAAPDADAVVLLTERTGRIEKRADDFVNILQYEWRMKILTEAGERFGEMHIPASRNSRVTNIRARTIRPDGTFTTVDPSQIFEKVLYKTRSYNVSDWVFNFPGVEPGVILELQYDRYDDYLFYIQPFYFEGPEYTLKAKVSQGVPYGMSYSLLCGLCPPGTSPTTRKWREGKSKGEFFEFELTDLPGYRDEMLMPPQREVSPRVEMVLSKWKDRMTYGLGRQDYFFTDWNSVARFAGTFYKEATETGLTWAKRDVEHWVAGITDPEEKIHAIIDHIQRDFRHIDWGSVGGWTRPVQYILETKTADNEESVILALTALRLEKIEAYPALVSGNQAGTVNPKFFSLSQFSHVVLALPLPGGGYRWIDPSLKYAPMGFGSWRNSGADALLIKGLEGELITLPKMMERSLTRYDVHVKPRANGLAEVDIASTFIGEDAVEMRERWAPESTKAQSTDIEAWVHKSLPGAEVLSQEFEDLENVDKPLVLDLKLTAPGLVTSAGDVALVDATPFAGYSSNPVSSRKREHPFFVDRGWNIQEEVTIAPPEGMEVSDVPPVQVAISGIARLTSRCSKQPDGGAQCSRTFVAPRRHWRASENVRFRSMFDKIVEIDRRPVAFRKREPSGAGGEPDSGAP